MNQFPFYWAVGIENTFIPQGAPGLRPLEEYELTQHYDLWRQDLDYVADLGVTHLRWGIPWYRVNPVPGQYDWSWTDEVLSYLVQKKGLTPIIDLVHYGTPLWLENSFFNPSYPECVADYAHAFASRYSDLIRYYTPLNEPTINAEYGGRRAEWPPYGTGDDGYVRLLLAVIRGMVLTTRAVRAANNNVTFVQVEAISHSWSADPSLDAELQMKTLQNYLAFDLFTGGVDHAHPLRPYLMSHGASEADLEWFRHNAGTVDILGINTYPWSGGEFVRAADGSPERCRLLTGDDLGIILETAWERYGLPLMVTETSADGDIFVRGRWMDGTIDAVRTARNCGIPVIGYTWFPVFTMIDWRYRCETGPVADYLIHLGLWDSQFDEDGILQRHPTPLVERYHSYVVCGAP